MMGQVHFSVLGTPFASPRDCPEVTFFLSESPTPAELGGALFIPQLLPKGRGKTAPQGTDPAETRTPKAARQAGLRPRGDRVCSPTGNWKLTPDL